MLQWIYIYLTVFFPVCKQNICAMGQKCVILCTRISNPEHAHVDTLITIGKNARLYKAAQQATMVKTYNLV